MKINIKHYKLQFLISLLLIFLLFIVIYRFTQTNKLQQISSSNPIAKSESTAIQTVSDTDIEEAKKVVEDYFNDLKTSDTVILKNYLGYNMLNLGDIGPCNVNSSNSALGFLYDTNFNPDLINIITSSKYDFDPLYYANEIKNQNNIDVYKILNLHVYFNYIKERDWDFILVKYTESSPWKIHLWIE